MKSFYISTYLTNSEIDKRVHSTQLLSEVLECFHSYHLSSDESDTHSLSLSDILLCFIVEYLVVFYCDRLKDSPLVTPHVFLGLYSLVSYFILNFICHKSY